MNISMVEKQNLQKQAELKKAIEKLLSCLPSNRNMDFFLDLVHRHHCFENSYNGKHRLMILGSAVPEELIVASGAVPYWILRGAALR